MTGPGRAQDEVSPKRKRADATPGGLVKAAWLLATAVARQFASRFDDRLARRLSAGSDLER